MARADWPVWRGPPRASPRTPRPRCGSPAFFSRRRRREEPCRRAPHRNRTIHRSTRSHPRRRHRRKGSCPFAPWTPGCCMIRQTRSRSRDGGIRRAPNPTRSRGWTRRPVGSHPGLCRYFGRYTAPRCVASCAPGPGRAIGAGRARRRRMRSPGSPRRGSRFSNCDFGHDAEADRRCR